MKKIIAFLTALLGFLSLPTSCTNKEERVYYDYDLTPYVTLGKYTGIEVELKSTEVSQEALKNELNYWLNYYGYTTYKEVADRSIVRAGDVVNIDYNGTIDGKEFEGGSETGKDLKIGSDEFIEGFEDNIIGAKKGSTITFKVTFPTDTGDELAGKLAEFEVTINSISKVVYDKLTDDIVYDMTDGKYYTVDEFTNYVEGYLEDDIVSANTDLIWDAVVANCEIIDYPQVEIDSYIEDTYEYYEEEAVSSDLSLDELLQSNYSMTADEFKKQTEESAYENVKKEMIAYAIAKAEGIGVSDREYTNGLDDYAEYYGYETDNLEDEIGKEQIKKWILIEKVIKFVSDNVINTAEATTVK